MEALVTPLLFLWAEIACRSSSVMVIMSTDARNTRGDEIFQRRTSKTETTIATYEYKYPARRTNVN